MTTQKHVTGQSGSGADITLYYSDRNPNHKPSPNPNLMQHQPLSGMELRCHCNHSDEGGAAG